MARDFISRWRRLARPFVDLIRSRRCRRAWRRGEAAGDWVYVAAPSQPSAPSALEDATKRPPPLTIYRPHDAAEPATWDAWRDAQTLADVPVVADDSAVRPWAFFAPGPHLPALDPNHLQAALLVLAAEDVDAVVLQTDAETPQDESQAATADDIGPAARRWAVYRSAAYGYDAAADRVIARRSRRLIKYLTSDVATPDVTTPAVATPAVAGPRRRGPYRATADLPGRLRVGVRDARRVLDGVARPNRPDAATGRPTMLVMGPFLARGGAEQTLFATLEHLRDRFDYLFVTLAPHRPELGDRRDDFRRLSPHLFSLGDWVHPAAMVGLLTHLIEVYGVSILYNANGTTLFYEFAPRLKAAFPELRIVDHLYDHRVGYVEQYDRRLLSAVDACVAENHPIQRELERRGWPTERAPVVWPCGRPADAFPDDPEAARRRLREALEIPHDAVVFLSAVRMHAQKRPLDFVALAQRCADLDHVLFLVVGGGELEDQMDAAIVEATAPTPGRPPAPIRRLPFRRDIPDLICAADLGILLSDYEGLPVFLLECLQMGRPFLGTDVGELGRVVQETGAGCIVETPGDLDALEQAVRRLMDVDLRQQLARRAHDAARHFSVEACSRRYAQVFLGEPMDSLDGILAATDADGSPPRGAPQP